MSSPSTTIKTANRQAIISHLYHHGPQTKQMLERELGLSLPTITQNLRTLTDEGLVEQGEPMDSTGGRKAQTFVFKAQSHAAIGITMVAGCSLRFLRIEPGRLDRHGGGGSLRQRHYAQAQTRNILQRQRLLRYGRRPGHGIRR